jgi:hypothetical protein
MYWYVFDVMMLFYIPLTSWPNIYTFCTAVQKRAKFALEQDVKAYRGMRSPGPSSQKRVAALTKLPRSRKVFCFRAYYWGQNSGHLGHSAFWWRVTKSVWGWLVFGANPTLAPSVVCTCQLIACKCPSLNSITYRFRFCGFVNLDTWARN